jgi:hypothetical protein
LHGSLSSNPAWRVLEFQGVAKLLLLSVIINMIALPVLMARDPSPMRSVKRTVFFTIAFNAFYLLAIRYIYPKLL